MTTPLVYFIHPRGGGPIKVGVSRDFKTRLQGLNGWSPNGLETLATIPGGEMREAAIKWLLNDRGWNASEWFAPDATVWKLVIEAQETGDLAWLPPEPIFPKWTPNFKRPEDYKEAVAYFGSRARLAERTGYKISSLGGVCSNWHPSPAFVARVEIEKLRDAGLLPAYLMSSPASARAA